MPCDVSSQLEMSVTPYGSAAARSARALNMTSQRRVPSGAEAADCTTAGAIWMSSAVGGVMPNWLFVSPVEGSEMRNVTRVEPIIRSIASAARASARGRPGIRLIGVSLSGISAYFLRREGRQHGLHRGIEQRVGKIFQPHLVQRARLYVQRRIGLRITHNLGARKLDGVRNLREARRIGQ